MALPLAAVFMVVALLYASVGFGGGSTYNALLVLNGTDYRLLPSIALICNIIVVAGGVWRFGRAGHIRLARVAPFVIASVPLALLGGRLPVSEVVFVGLLGLSLLAVGGQMLFQQELKSTETTLRTPPRALSFTVGGGLGFISGIVGIGGGIFLAPILYMMRWGRPRDIAGAASFFILVNSVSGLAGQVWKLDNLALTAELSAYWLLFPAVFIGGQIGSRLGALALPESFLRRITAILVLYVAARLLSRWYSLALN